MRDTIEPDILPWLMEATQDELNKLNGHKEYPSTLINNHMATRSQRHVEKVKEYNDMIEARRAAEKQAAEDKIAAKLARKRKREAEAKAAQIAKLKEEIKENFIDKATPVEEILKQPYVEIDGWGAENKPQVTFIGGFIGQLMMVLNTVAKYYPQLDRPSKSSKSALRGSQDSRPKSVASQKSGKASQKSGKSGASEDARSEIPR